MSPALILLAAGGAVLALGAAWLVWRSVSGDATHLGGVHPNRGLPEPGPAPAPESRPKPGPGPVRGGETLEELVRAGSLIEAVKRVREQTGLGLAEAKERVDHFKAHGRWPAAAAPAPREAAESEPQLRQLETLIRQGNMIQAIKLAREQNPGMDLKTAKELVEVLAARMR